MDTKNGLSVKQETRPVDCDHRAVHQLRAVAAGSCQTEAHRQWIRAATQC